MVESFRNHHVILRDELLLGTYVGLNQHRAATDNPVERRDQFHGPGENAPSVKQQCEKSKYFEAPFDEAKAYEIRKCEQTYQRVA